MAREAIERVCQAEAEAENVKKIAFAEIEKIVKKAQKDGAAIIAAKEKEAKAKAELRVNFAKNEAKEFVKKAVKIAAQEALFMQQNAEKKIVEARKIILSILANT